MAARWLRPFFALLATGLALLAGFRLTLCLLRLEADVAGSALLETFWLGARLDLSVLALLLLPLALSLALVAQPHRSRWVAGYGGGVLLLLSLFEFGGLFFFAYYDFRPNYLVLEYAGDPEVVTMLMAQYPIPAMLLGGLFVAGLAYFVFHRLAGLSLRDITSQARLHGLARLSLALLLVALCVVANRGKLGSRRINPSLAAFSSDRLLNEIAGSGLYNVIYEVDQRLADRYGNLASHLELLPAEAAEAEVRQHFAAPPGRGTRNPLRRRVAQAEQALPRNVVLVVMESFTGRLVGSLGGSPALSPHFDRLADRGTLLANCYATGERTIQGLEALVSSFPPLPGVSAIRRPEARSGFATLASTLKQRGYATTFYYGGNASFDQMRGFFRGNDFDRVIEDGDFEDPTFRGKWGVSDEDLFQRADQDFSRAHASGKPFFAVLLTVSLHSPWEYPEGRIQTLPATTQVPPGFDLEELDTYRYADWAVGDFIERAEKQAYAKDTLFVFAADHGVHLRGRTLVPSEEYRVPVLFYAPGWLPAQRIEGVTSQLDVAPTILGILGGAYESTFFGSDVLTQPGGPGFAPMIYRKEIYGVRAADRLSVLGNGAPRSYRVSAEREVTEAPLTPEHRKDARRTLALLQVAETLLRTRSFTAD